MENKPCNLNAPDRPNAAAILGYRSQGPYTGWPTMGTPGECGYACPIDGLADPQGAQLAWGNLNGMLYCGICGRDIPSPLCLPMPEMIDYAIDIFLRIIRSAQDFGPNFLPAPDQGGPTLDRPESFAEAIRNDPTMTQAQKAAWLNEFSDLLQARGLIDQPLPADLIRDHSDFGLSPDLLEALPMSASEADQIADEQADRFKERGHDNDNV